MSCDSANRAMERHLAGDARAFADVYRLVARRLFAYIVRRTHDRAAAEDVLQTVFFRMARARYAPGADVTAWAFAIARRLLIDRARSARRRVTVADADPEDAHAAPSADPERTAQIAQAARRLGRALAALPEAQRVAFALIKVEGLSVAETASRVAATDIAVKLRAHRAQEALRDVYLEAVA